MPSSLKTGTQLGRYEIRSKIGEGGMGEVYLAEDTKLNRKVALKILPAKVASKQERMTRFVREARAAAALNHPNIAHIYEIGEEDGVNLIAMEFVDGQTLRQKIHREHTDLRKLLRYLQQVAEGLAKAHAAGIVHRDLKPDNIMISRDGYAKILDFGLAKLIEPTVSTAEQAGSDERLSEVATAFMPQHSLPGTIMGTAGYMSPEQAQGRIDEIDHRSDIFAFGCILFEAATKRKAFEGKDNLDSLHNIVHAPTPQIKDLNPLAPIELQKIVRRCLAKDPERRYQSIKDVAIELDELRQELKQGSELHDSIHQTETGVSSTSTGQPETPVGTLTDAQTTASSTRLDSTQGTSSSKIILNELKRHKTGAIFAVLAVVIVAVGGFFAWKKIGGGTAKPGPGAGGMKISRLVSGRDDIGGVSISPDGKYIAYASFKDDGVSIRVRQVSTGSDREIVTPVEDAGITGTTFSPDGELIYYSLFHRDKNPLGTLYQVPVIGGREPKKILEHLNSIVGFAADGKRFAFVRYDRKSDHSFLMVGNIDGSEPRTLAKRTEQDWFNGIPTWSPDGSVIVCPVGTDTGGTQFSLVEVPAAGGPEKAITTYKWRGGINRPYWLKDGSGLIVNASETSGNPMQIWHVSYPGGAVTRITNDLTAYGTASFGLTADSSTIVTIATERTSKLYLAGANEEEARAIKLTSGKYDGQAGIDILPDGRVVYVTKSGDYWDLSMINANGTGQRQLTSNDDAEFGVQVSRDGRYIVFGSQRVGGVAHIWRMDADGGNLKQLTQGEFGDDSPVCSPDGQWVVFNSWRSGKSRLWRVSMDGGEPVQISDQVFIGSSFLPDGKLIFGTYFDAQVTPPRQRLAIVSLETGQVVKVFDSPPRTRGWKMPDERTLLYSETKNDIDNLWSLPLEGGSPTQLTRFSSEQIFDYARSRDGKQFAVVRGTASADIILIKDFR
jgi:serine/threonine protein kinase/Tol biopolymer transport system component